METCWRMKETDDNKAASTKYVLNQQERAAAMES